MIKQIGIATIKMIVAMFIILIISTPIIYIISKYNIVCSIIVMIIFSIIDGYILLKITLLIDQQFNKSK